MIRTDYTPQPLPTPAAGQSPRNEGAPAGAFPALRGTRNGSLPSAPVAEAPVRAAKAPPSVEYMQRTLVWAPSGFGTSAELKSSFRFHMNTLVTDIDSARGHRFKLEHAYALFAERADALLGACTPARISPEESDRIATVVLQELRNAPQQPPFEAAAGLSTVETARQAAAYYARR